MFQIWLSFFKWRNSLLVSAHEGGIIFLLLSFSQFLNFFDLISNASEKTKNKKKINCWDQSHCFLNQRFFFTKWEKIFFYETDKENSESKKFFDKISEKTRKNCEETKFSKIIYVQKEKKKEEKILSFTFTRCWGQEEQLQLKKECHIIKNNIIQ